MYYSYMDSPIGPLLLAGSRHALKVIGFSRGDKARTEEDYLRHSVAELEKSRTGSGSTNRSHASSASCRNTSTASGAPSTFRWHRTEPTFSAPYGMR